MRIIIPAIQVPFISGGAERMTQGLCRALKRRGHEVEIVTAPFKFFPESYIDNLIDFWTNQDFNDFNGKEIDKVIALKFPAYYVNHKKKIVWLMHQHRAVYDTFDENRASGELKALKEKIERNDYEALSSEKKIYSMSQNITDRLKKFNHIGSEPLYHPPYGETLFYCEEPYHYIYCPSRHEILKRQDLLIKAMQHVRSPVKAIISGDGGQTSYYQRLIEELGLESKVKLVGFITEEEKYTLYARCLAVFFGPYDEDYGYVTLESMLSSKPLITCTDSGGPLEFVLDDETGFIVQPEPRQISEKIDWLFYNKKRGREMGRRGMEVYREYDISWENVIDRLLQ